MIRITFVMNPAPSNRAASKISFGIASIAALQSTTQKPMFFQKYSATNTQNTVPVSISLRVSIPSF